LIDGCTHLDDDHRARPRDIEDYEDAAAPPASEAATGGLLASRHITLNRLIRSTRAVAQPIARAIEEEEEVARQRIVPEAVPHESVQRIEAAPKIHHLARHEDAHPRREREHHAPSNSNKRFSVGS